MISQEAAWEKIASLVSPLPQREVRLLEALDCFLSGDLSASHSLPPFDNSAMDGYAVIAQSFQAGGRLKVIGEQPAGADRNLSIKPGEAVRIFTGAPIPTGADAVVMQEDVSAEGEEIVIACDVEVGEFVRRRGGDVAVGQTLANRGDKVTPQMIALFAAQGLSSLFVGGEVRAAVISTGDELVSAERQLATGQIYDSNSFLLCALLQQCGAKVATVTHCADRAEEIEAAVRVATNCDIMIITGGVSVGARDFVKGAITAAGGSLDLWRVAVKPGKPFVFGRVGACSIFGLPGNPVSAFTTFVLFVRPALLKLMGAGETARTLPSHPARLQSEVANKGDRPHYIRGVLRDGIFSLVGRQESHALFGLSQSNALLLIRPQEVLAAGTVTTVFTWD
ncbi:MAG: gephyrin-like molybdotransferase Glp [Chthoniobacterales bacterium]